MNSMSDVPESGNKTVVQELEERLHPYYAGMDYNDYPPGWEELFMLAKRIDRLEAQRQTQNPDEKVPE